MGWMAMTKGGGRRGWGNLKNMTISLGEAEEEADKPADIEEEVGAKEEADEPADGRP